MDPDPVRDQTLLARCILGIAGVEGTFDVKCKTITTRNAENHFRSQSNHDVMRALRAMIVWDFIEGACGARPEVSECAGNRCGIPMGSGAMGDHI